MRARVMLLLLDFLVALAAAVTVRQLEAVSWRGRVSGRALSQTREPQMAPPQTFLPDRHPDAGSVWNPDAEVRTSCGWSGEAAPVIPRPRSCNSIVNVL